MTVQAVVRAFDVLKTVAAHPNGIGVTAIARQTDLHKSTVSRLLTTLEAVDAVAQLEQGTNYVLNDELVQLFAPVSFPDDLIAVARPTLITLNAAIGEDVGLAIRDGDHVLYIDQIASDRAVQVMDWTGQRFPLHTTSTGKLILAWQTDAFVARYVGRPLEAFTAKTRISADAIMAAVTQVRAEGIDWAFGEFADGLNAAAAPIVDADGRLIAAVNIYGPSFRFPNGNRADVTAKMKAAAATITQKFQEMTVDKLEKGV